MHHPLIPLSYEHGVRSASFYKTEIPQLIKIALIGIVNACSLVRDLWTKTHAVPGEWREQAIMRLAFFVIEGGLIIEFEHGEIQLTPCQTVTVSRGVRRTPLVGRRSVNLTFEGVAWCSRTCLTPILRSRGTSFVFSR